VKKRIFNLIVTTAVILLVVLMFQNLDTTEIRFLFKTVTVSTAALILASWLLGALTAPLFLHWFKGRWGKDPSQEKPARKPPEAGGAT